MRWVNGDPRSHTIKSDTNAWRAFTLGPGSRHSVLFRRSGRFPYRLDGRVKGVVLVTAGGRTPPPLPPASGCVPKRQYRYAITITGRIQFDATPDPPETGFLMTDDRWRHTLPNVRVRATCNRLTGLVDVTTGPSTGIADETFDYSDHVQRQGFPVPCEYRWRGRFGLRRAPPYPGGTGSRGKPRSYFFSFNRPEYVDEAAVVATDRDAFHSQCAERVGGTFGAGRPARPVSAHGLTFAGRGSFAGTGTGAFTLVERLYRGVSFAIVVGPTRVPGDTPFEGTSSARVSLRYEFRRLRQ